MYSINFLKRQKVAKEIKQHNAFPEKGKVSRLNISKGK